MEVSALMSGTGCDWRNTQVGVPPCSVLPRALLCNFEINFDLYSAQLK